MNLLEKLVEIPQRESSGSLTSNRYDYQYNWSLLKLLEITKSLKDFLMVFEFCEDTIVLDSATKPQNIDFYQVKTNKQQNKLNWVISDFTKKKKDSNKESIVEKLIDNYNKYDNNVHSINLVSNLPFKFKDKVIKSDTIVQLKEIDEECINQLKVHICEKCNKDKANCKNKCLDIIYFNCTSLQLENYESTLIGKLAQFLLDENAQNINPTAFYKTLISEIKQKSKVESVRNVNDLIKLKSFSRTEFFNKLRQYEENCKLYNNWNSLDPHLSKLYTISKVQKIKKEFAKFKEDSLDSTNTYLENIVDLVRKTLANNPIVEISDKELKEFFDRVVDTVVSLLGIKSAIYSSDYILSIVIREYFSE
jgi:hypothetical protein